MAFGSSLRFHDKRHYKKNGHPRSERIEPPLRRVFSTFLTTSTHMHELSYPAPPLCQSSSFSLFFDTDPCHTARPRTFWCNTKRSGVTGASYSPDSHVVQRATFLVAGLSLDAPVADLSTLGVESRGAFFTSKLPVLSDHKPVTSGPYAYAGISLLSK